MTNIFSGIRAAALVALVLVCAGCGSSTPQAAPTRPGTPSATETPTKPRLPRLIATGRGTEAKPPPHETAQERALVAGVNGFCRDWYADQRAAAQRFPADPHQFAVVVLAHETALTHTLEALTPPPSMATDFAGFVANEEDMLRARQMQASTDSVTVQAGDEEYDSYVIHRHIVALSLGASMCDGVLPAAQAVAAERAAQRYDLTKSPREACHTLVTSSFLATQWAGQPGSKLALCRDNLRRHLATGPHHNIRVTGVSGVNDLSATVSFTEIPECGCGTVQLRFYFERGRWLLNSAGFAS